jgi:hypothetical protein
MLVFVLTALLCFLYAANNVILSHCYRYYAHNPATVKLLLLSEAVKLFIASCLWLTDKEAAGILETNAINEDREKCLSGDVRVPAKLNKQQQASSTRVFLWYSGRAWAWTVLAFSMPSLCYFTTNK